MAATEHLDAAFEAALLHYEEIMGQQPVATPRVRWIDTPEFWASVERDGDGYLLQVTTGLVDKTAQLWADAYADEGFQAGAGQPVASDAAQMTHISLIWLMLHELHHIDLNHFDLTGGFHIAETRNAPCYSVAQRAALQPDPMMGLPPDLRIAAPLCLELQADHDAAEMLLEAYSPQEWESLRHRAMAVSAMMMLIEREDTKHGDKGKTHPKAATRIFQLLGHVAELPLIPAQVQARLKGADQIDPDDLPPEAEQQAYGRQVTIPCFFDAVNLARIADADTIRHDLGEAQAFFSDIEVAKSADPDRFATLSTQGAQEWARLALSNRPILSALGVEQFI